MADDRKTLEQRAQMSDIERLRHSAAHVLATAILKIWPDAQFAAGPPVENGFYYDLELDHRISPEDFEKIEAEMEKEVKANHTFERVVVPREEALDMAKRGVLGHVERFFARDDDALEGVVGFHFLFHLGLDLLEIFGRDAVIQFEVVIKTVLDRRTGGELRVGPDFENGCRENV